MRKVLGVAVGLCVVAGVLMTAFLGPSRVAALHGVRLGVVGPQAARAHLAAGLDAHAAGGFVVAPEPNPAAARTAVAERRLDAAVVLAPSGGTWQLLTASAASTTLATAVTSALRSSASAAGATLAVDDVVVPGPADPHATAPFFVVLPLVIAGLLAVVALTLVLGRLRLGELLAGLVVFAVGGGLVAAAVAAGILGALGGHAGALIGAGALVAAAVAWAAAGLRSLLGVAGIGVAALVVLVVGTTSSGGPTAVALLPDGWRQIGPWLPPGAGTELVRDTVYFAGHGAGRSVVVLAVWAAAGLALVVVGALRRQPAATPPAA